MALNRPLFWLALLAAGLVLIVELAVAGGIGGVDAGALTPATAGVEQVSPAALAQVRATTPPGSAIRALAFVDGLVLFALGVIWAGSVVSQRAYARVQGVVTLVVALLWILGGLVAFVLAFVQLLVMVGLFVAAPFGTIAYLAVWGFFPVAQAQTVLGLLLLLKLVMVGLLAGAQPKFLTIKGLMVLIGLSVLLQLVLGILYGWLPRVVVSIADQLWAVVSIVVALIWAVVMLVTAIPAVLRAARVSTARSQ